MHHRWHHVPRPGSSVLTWILRFVLHDGPLVPTELYYPLQSLWEELYKDVNETFGRYPPGEMVPTGTVAPTFEVSFWTSTASAQRRS